MRRTRAERVVAYSDNSSVIEGAIVDALLSARRRPLRRRIARLTHILMKVETHNHPTAIAPFPGAATGSGGEIRDEGATGIGAKPKAGLVGFTVSHLRIPALPQPWESDVRQAGAHRLGAVDHADGPIGAAAFNNEFGRPNLPAISARSSTRSAGEMRGYHKPIMIAGGVGNIRAAHTHKQPLADGTLLIQLGGPGMLIGMGGGAASSMATGANTADLDFDSVQRGNAEIERRAQEVIDRCWQLGERNPILSIHDVGAGGLSNALPELVHGGGVGGTFDLRARAVRRARDVAARDLVQRSAGALRARDRAGRSRAVSPRSASASAVRSPSSAAPTRRGTARRRRSRISATSRSTCRSTCILGKPPKMTRDVAHVARTLPPLDLAGVDAATMRAYRVLQLPAVADKTFLVTIGDRTVGGLCSRDPMVGPWQVPVADVAVTLDGLRRATPARRWRWASARRSR